MLVEGTGEGLLESGDVGHGGVQRVQQGGGVFSHGRLTSGGWRSCSTCTAGGQVEVHPVVDRLGSLSARIASPFEGRTDEPRAYACARQKSSAAVDLI